MLTLLLSQVCPLTSSPPPPPFLQTTVSQHRRNSFHLALTSTHGPLAPLAPRLHTWKRASHPAVLSPTPHGPLGACPRTQVHLLAHRPGPTFLSSLTSASWPWLSAGWSHLSPIPTLPHPALQSPLFCWGPCWRLLLLRQADSALQ